MTGAPGKFGEKRRWEIALRYSGLDPCALNVGRALVSWMRADGSGCAPWNDELVEACGASESYVYRGLRTLRENHWLTHRSGGRGRPTLYTPIIPAWVEAIVEARLTRRANRPGAVVEWLCPVDGEAFMGAIDTRAPRCPRHDEGLRPATEPEERVSPVPVLEAGKGVTGDTEESPKGCHPDTERVSSGGVKGVTGDRYRFKSLKSQVIQPPLVAFIDPSGDDIDDESDRLRAVLERTSSALGIGPVADPPAASAATSPEGGPDGAAQAG